MNNPGTPNTGIPPNDNGAEATPFEKELCQLINKYSYEYPSNTPDFILAEYLNKCLSAYNMATIARKNWHHSKLEAL